MKVRDLEYVENELIAEIETFINDMIRFTFELEQNALSNAAELAAIEEQKKKGEVGLGTRVKKPSTRPISPRLTKTRPPILPEPERIEQNVRANAVPDYLEKTNLQKITNQKAQKREELRKKTASQYSEKDMFRFHETKGGRDIEQVKKEIELQRTSELAFNSTFVNEPPDFSKMSAKIRLNASSIYREDALFRKQQAKDAQLLRNYDEELRDPVEYYLWQQDLKERDEVEKLKHVAMRREQAKMSAEEAKYAMTKQREDNYTVANMMREQAEIIKQQKLLEKEIQMLQNQEVVSSVIQVRETMPKIATQKVLEERKEQSKELRAKLEAARLMKEEAERLEEEIKNDRIRQLRAENTVHRKHIKVFDPTETAGIGLLDEMSYMEMKERLAQEKKKLAEQESYKRDEIIDTKQHRATDLERRANAVMRARQIKAEASKKYRQQSKEKKVKEEELKERAREEAAMKLEVELRERREVSRAEKAALLAEQERIRRQQQYLGAALGQVEETREEQQILAKEREIGRMQRKIKERAVEEEESKHKDMYNKQVVIRKARQTKEKEMAEKEKQFEFEKRAAMDKMKADEQYKTEMYKTGKKQQETTKKTLVDHNPYAATISEESLFKVHTMKVRNGNSTKYTSVLPSIN